MIGMESMLDLGSLAYGNGLVEGGEAAKIGHLAVQPDSGDPCEIATAPVNSGYPGRIVSGTLFVPTVFSVTNVSQIDPTVFVAHAVDVIYL